MSGVYNLVQESDTANQQAGGTSFFERLGDAATYGVGAAVVSGLQSIGNTAIFYGNKLFDADIEEFDTKRTLMDINDNWGKYYEDNKMPIDTVGFVATSFLPGALAVKGLKLAQSGKLLGTFGRNTLGLTTSLQEGYLAKGLKEVAQEGGNIFTQINSNKMLSIAAGAADNALQTAFFETSVALTMNQSPFLEGEDWKDITADIFKQSAFGGILGGGIEALWTNRIFRNAGQLVDRSLRPYDTLAVLDKLDLAMGDKAFDLADQLLGLPKEVLGEGVLKFGYRLNGKNMSTDLDLTNLIDRKIKDTATAGWLKFQKSLTEAVSTDKTVGSALGESLFNMVGIYRKAGKTDDEIRQSLGDVLYNLQGIRGVHTETDLSKDIVFINKKENILAKDDTAKEIFSLKRRGDVDTAYQVVGSFSDLKHATMNVEVNSIKQAWDRGFDSVTDIYGKIHVNPKSAILKPYDEDPKFIKAILHTPSGKIVEQASPTIADLGTSLLPLQIAGSKIVAGGKTFTNFIDSTLPDSASIAERTARYLWASSLESLPPGAKIPGHDFAILDRVLQNPKVLGKEAGITVDIGEAGLQDIVSADDLPNWLLGHKLNTLQEFLSKNSKASPLELSYRLNTSQDWVEKAIASKFDLSAMKEVEGMTRNLEKYAQRDNVLLMYDAKVAKQMEDGTFPTSTLAYEYRKKEAVQKVQAAAASVLGTHYAKLPGVNSQELSGLADAANVGASFTGASNANYGDKLRQFAQYTGRQVALMRQEVSNDILNSVQGKLAVIQTSPNLGAELGALLTKGRLSAEPLSLFVDPISREVSVVDAASFASLKKKMEKDPQAYLGFKFTEKYAVSKEVGEFLDLHHNTIQADLVGKRNILSASQGVPTNWNPDHLYFPPIDTRRFPYFAFVRPLDGTAFAGSEVGMITAKDANELKRLADGIDAGKFQVIFKTDSEEYYKAKGLYDYSRALNSPTLDPMLRKQGKLGDFMPTLEGKAVVEDFLNHYKNTSDGLIRDAVSVNYAQTVAELDWLSSQYKKVQTSQFKYLGLAGVRNIQDPFKDYVSLMLDKSKQSEFTLWHQLNEFVDALGSRAYDAVAAATQSAREGKISWEQANQKLVDFGLPAPFTSQSQFLLSQVGNSRNLVKTAISKANTFLSNFGLRLDFFNSLVNVISTPILLGTEVSSIRNSLKLDKEMSATVGNLLTTAIPGLEGQKVPSTLKLIYNAVRNVTGENKEQLLARYNDIGVTKNIVSQYHQMNDSLALTPNIVPTAWAEKVNGLVEKGAKWTGSNLAEDFTRAVSGDVMRQITEPLVLAGKMGVKEQNAFITTFVNRVQGNYISSQRPILFQGTLGAALGLFQTYQFNLLQQLFRHIENRDGKTLAVLGAWQTGTFGLNGLPLFDAINTHIIGSANINEGHNDAYSFATQVAGKDLGDWLLYGTASGLPILDGQLPSLYTRGDINPRHPTIIPISPAQVPAVEASARFAGNILNMGKQIAQGADIGPTLLMGLEHNGINRPLAGLAQVIQGFSTSATGNINSASDLASIATFSRILGARPMDESIALNTQYRQVAYKAADRERIRELGTVVKQKVRSGDLTPEDVQDFAAKYAQVGGRADNYAQALHEWTRDAKQSTINKIMQAHRSPYGQRMIEVMGGDQLPDLLNTESAAGD